MLWKPLSSAAPPARRGPAPSGFGVCGLSEALWRAAGQGLIWERSNVATVGLFGVPLLNLWVEGLLWESSRPPCFGTPRDQIIFFNSRCIPLLDLRMSCCIMMGSLDGSGRSSKRSRVKASATFISFMANCCPMQFLGRGDKCSDCFLGP